MKLLNFTIIKLTIFLVFGILLAHYLTLSFLTVLYATIVLVIVLGIYWLVLKSKINRSPFFGCIAFIAMIGVGILSYNLQDETLRPEHYTNFDPDEPYSSVVFQIKERLKPDLYNDKYIVTLKSFNNEVASGHLLINIRRDSLNNLLMSMMSFLLQLNYRPFRNH